MAEWYSADLKQKVSRSKERRAKLGLWNGDLPFGYSLSDKRAVVVDEEASIIQTAYEKYASGLTTYEGVASWLNTTSFRPRGKRRDRQDRQYLWSKDTVKAMLRNEFYLGFTKYKGERLPGAHDAIVNQDLFNRCQETRKRHHRGPWTFTPKHRTYLLGGLVRCAECGSNLWAQHLHGLDYYREESRRRGLLCPQGKAILRADAIEAEVEEIVTSLKLPDTWRDVVTYYLGLADEREQSAKEKARLGERLKRLQSLYLDGYPESEYRRERQAIETALQALSESGLEDVFIQGDNIEGLVEAWAPASREEKRDILQMMLNAVYVDTSTGRLVSLDVKPSFRPLFMAWLETPGSERLTFGSAALCMARSEGFEPPTLGSEDQYCTQDIILTRADVYDFVFGQSSHDGQFPIYSEVLLTRPLANG